MDNPFAKNSIDILTFRIEQEEASSRLYHAMALWLNNRGYTGAAKAWQKDADDEMKHSTWAKDYLLDMGVNPKLPTIIAPAQEFTGLPDIIRQSFAHEVKITQQCNELALYAYTNGNHLLYQLALKYLQEQQEELGKVQTYMDKLKAFGEDPIAMKLFDNELGE
jgi:ferritin